MSRLTAFKCPSCNASLNYDGSSETIRCEFCNNTIIIPENMRAGVSQAGYMGQESPEKADVIHQVLELLHHGQKIQAIKIYRDSFDVGLKEAKETIDHLTSGQPTAVFTTTSSSSTTTTVGGGKAAGCGCFVWLIFMVMLFGGIAIAFLFSSKAISSLSDLPTSSEELESFLNENFSDISTISSNIGFQNRSLIGNPIIATQGGDGLGADLLLDNYAYGLDGDSDIMLTYLTTADGRRQIRWETAVADIDSNQAYNATLDNKYVYASSGKTVYAFSRQDGSEVWRANLSDIVSKQCQACLRVQDGMLIALTADSTLYGIDTNSGQEKWQVRLERDANRFLSEGFAHYALLNGRVIVLDAGENATQFIVRVLDATTGELVQTLNPSCTDEDNFFSPAPLGYYSQLLVNEEKGTLYFLFGENINGAYCLEQWDAETGQPIWQTRLPDGGSISSMLGGGLVTEWSGSPFFIFGQDRLMVPVDGRNQEDGVALFDLSNGELILHFAHPDYEVWPLGVSGDTAVVWAEKTRGSSQLELWGVESSSGKRKWSHPLTAEYLFENDPFDDRWTYYLVDQNLYIIQLLTDANPANLLVQSLNVHNGALNYETENKLSDDHWQGITRTEDRLYLVFRSLVEIDLATGQQASTWLGN